MSRAAIEKIGEIIARFPRVLDAEETHLSEPYPNHWSDDIELHRFLPKQELTFKVIKNRGFPKDFPGKDAYGRGFDVDLGEDFLQRHDPSHSHITFHTHKASEVGTDESEPFIGIFGPGEPGTLVVMWPRDSQKMNVRTGIIIGARAGDNGYPQEYDVAWNPWTRKRPT